RRAGLNDINEVTLAHAERNASREEAGTNKRGVGFGSGVVVHKYARCGATPGGVEREHHAFSRISHWSFSLRQAEGRAVMLELHDAGVLEDFGCVVDRGPRPGRVLLLVIANVDRVLADPHGVAEGRAVPHIAKLS